MYVTTHNIRFIMNHGMVIEVQAAVIDLFSEVFL